MSSLFNESKTPTAPRSPTARHPSTNSDGNISSSAPSRPQLIPSSRNRELPRNPSFGSAVVGSPSDDTDTYMSTHAMTFQQDQIDKRDRQAWLSQERQRRLQQQQRRQHQIRAFLKQGEQNEAFRSKAPSIVPTYDSPAASPYQTRPSSPQVWGTGAISSNSGLHQRFQRSGSYSDLGSEASESESDEPTLLRSNSYTATVTQATANIGGTVQPSAPPATSLSAEPDDDFSTWDWTRHADMHLHEQKAHDQARITRWRRKRHWFWKCASIPYHIGMSFFHHAQGWIVCAIVGFFTGLLASIVDMSVHWATDLRTGYCSDNFFLSNSFCCARLHTSVDNDNVDSALEQQCPNWIPWSDALTGSSGSSHSSPWSFYWFGYLIYIMWSALFAGTAAWLVKSFAPYAAGSGVPEIKTILGGVLIKQVLGAWTLLVKCVGLVLTVGSGLSLGKEGPFVHIAGCVSNVTCRFFPRYHKNHGKSNEILSAACAAGVAVAFGAPVGGILFSLEEMSSYFPHKTMWRAFFCSVVASLSIQYIDPYQEGKLVQFAINYDRPWFWFEALPFALLGCLGGLVGAFFIHFNLKMSRFRSNSFMKQYPVTEVVIVAAFTAVIKYLSAFTRGNSNNVISVLFADCSHAPAIDPLKLCDNDFVGETLVSLFFTFISALLLTCYSNGMKVPAGLLIPSLTIGASMGRFVGTIVRLIQVRHPDLSLFDSCTSTDNCITPGIYAIVGAAAVLGGITRMTITLAVIMFEITGGLSYLLPIMLGVMFSKVVGDFFGRHSIYEGYITMWKYPYMDLKDDIDPQYRVRDAMSKDLLVLTMHGHTVETLLEQIALAQNLNIAGFPVVTTYEEMLVVGYIRRAELRAGLQDALKNSDITMRTRCYFAMLDLRFPKNEPYVDLRPWMHPTPVQVVDAMPLYRIHDMFQKLGLRYSLVSRFGKLTGIITKKDILRCTHAEH